MLLIEKCVYISTWKEVIWGANTKITRWDGIIQVCRIITKSYPE